MEVSLLRGVFGKQGTLAYNFSLQQALYFSREGKVAFLTEQS